MPATTLQPWMHYGVGLVLLRCCTHLTPRDGAKRGVGAAKGRFGHCADTKRRPGKCGPASSHHRFRELGRADLESRQFATVQTEPDGLEQSRQFIGFREEVDVLLEE